MVVDEDDVEAGLDKRSVSGAEASSVDGTSDAAVFAFLPFLGLRGAVGRVSMGSSRGPGTTSGRALGGAASGGATFCAVFLAPFLRRDGSEIMVAIDHVSIHPIIC
jgi:hypothetical protein